jgi:hypothetical protein
MWTARFQAGYICINSGICGHPDSKQELCTVLTVGYVDSQIPSRRYMYNSGTCGQPDSKQELYI